MTTHLKKQVLMYFIAGIVVSCGILSTFAIAQTISPLQPFVQNLQDIATSIHEISTGIHDVQGNLTALDGMTFSMLYFDNNNTLVIHVGD